MNSKHYVELVERDAQVIEALSSALRVMRLLNGNRVELSGELRPLRLDDHLLKIHEALLVVGVDSNEIA